MADIFNEIDEELRGDQMRRLWASYSGVIIVFAVLIVLGVAGWRGWEYWSEQQARTDSDKYLAALQLSAKGDYQGANAQLRALETGGNYGYRTLARLRAADEMILAGDQPGALAAFDAIARDGSLTTTFQGFASIRAAYLALDLEDPAKLDARVKPLSVAGNPWRHAAREILAVAAWKAGDLAAAKSWVDQIESDADTPADLTNRITILSSVISAETKPNVTPAAVAPSAVPATSSAPETPPSPQTGQVPQTNPVPDAKPVPQSKAE